MEGGRDHLITSDELAPAPCISPPDASSVTKYSQWSNGTSHRPRGIMPVISNSEMILRKMAEEEEAKEEAARQWEASAAERAHKAKMAEQHAAKQARRRWARRCSQHLALAVP